MMDEMRVVGRVVGLFRYPVKSMLGETLTVVDARSSGFVGDRAFGLIDVWSSRLLSAKTVPALLLASAMFADGEVTMTLPTGIVSSADPNVDDTLSTWLDRDVRLARPTEGVASTIDIEVDLTERGGPEAAMFSFDTHSGSFFDGTPMHLLTSSSLRAMAGLYPAGNWALERFRPNVMIDVERAGEGFIEDGWVGSTLALGSMVANVHKRCDRCVLTTKQVGQVPADREILKALHRHHDGDLGVKATIAGDGTVRTGDLITLG